MNIKEFCQKLRECSKVGILLASMEPVILDKRIVRRIFKQWLGNRKAAQISGFTGQLFVLIAPLPGDEGFVLVLGAHEAMPGAEEVTL